MATAGGTPLYYVEDMLGTSRVITSNTGVVCYDADFYPYGGEHSYTNTCPQNYKFEGKERDSETGNDDFGARYYSNRFGRWLSADWSAIPVPVPYANLSNPQTLNLYAMVADDPETFADLDGHDGIPAVPSCRGKNSTDATCGPQSNASTAAQQALEIVYSALNNPDFALRLPLRIADDYNLDKYGHGAPHIDRVDKNGKLVGRYDENGNPIVSKRKTPPNIPNSDKGKFGKAAGKLREYKERLAKANAPKDDGQQQKSPAKFNPYYDDLCAGGPCDGFPSFLPLPTTLPAFPQLVPIPEMLPVPI